MKQIYLLLIALFSLSSIYAQNSNGIIDAPGDIAFVAYHDNVDGFSFVFLDACPNNTQIIFTDKEWNGTVFESGEGSVVWTNNTGNTIAKSVVINIQSANNTPNPSLGTAVETSGSGFTTGIVNDQIYAIIGSVVAEIPVPTAFLAFVGGLDGGVPATLTNTGLTNGLTATVIADFEGYFSALAVCNGTAIQCATMINTASNWSSGAYSFPGAVPTGFTGSTFPVEFVLFEGEISENTLKLYWQTASELNNEKFEIEESRDGRIFQKVGEINGYGTTSEKKDYDFIVERPQAGLNYFRLKQVDFDGGFGYSEIVSLYFNGDAMQYGEFYPNPSNSGILTLDFTPKDGGEIEVSVFDMRGKLMANQVRYISGRRSNMSFDFSNLNNGVYFIKIEDEVNPIFRKLVIELN